MSANSHFHSTHESHYQCAVCSSIDANPNSLAVNYQCLADGSVVGEFHVLPRHQGYTDLLHGGIASSLLDGAMTTVCYLETFKPLPRSWMCATMHLLS